MNQNGSAFWTDGEPPPKSSYKRMKITCIKILFCIFSLFGYIADISSDIYVAVKHYQDGNETYFYLTVVFIVLPAIIMSLTSFRWYSQDNSVPHLKASMAHWIIRIIFLILLMAPALRSAEALYYAWKSRNSLKVVDKENYGRRMIYENTDASFLRLFEAFLECAPQLILQIYIIAQMYCDGSNDISATEIVQLISIVISLIAMTNAIVSYLRNLRESLDCKKELKWSISIVPLLWRFFELTARVVTLGLFASVLLPYFFLVCSIHFCAMLLWIRCMKTDFCNNNKIAEHVYNIGLSFAYIFCFINPKDDRTQLRYILYYSVVFVENAVLISLWYHYCLFGYRLLVLSMVFVSFFLAVIIMVLYYVLLHPTRGKLFREPNPEGRIAKSQSDSITDQLALNRELVDRKERDRGMSEEMQTAVTENGKPTEENCTKEKIMECSEL